MVSKDSTSTETNAQSVISLDQTNSTTTSTEVSSSAVETTETITTVIETTIMTESGGISTIIPVNTEDTGNNNKLTTWTSSNSLDLLEGRVGQEIVYYKSASVYILFGGFSEDSIHSDTLVYNEKTNSWINSTSSNHPGPRAFHSMVYDSNFDKIILFGGTKDFEIPNSSLYNDLWIYDYMSNTWTERFPSILPDQRFLSSMIYDEKSERTVLFGGTNGDSDFFDTWGYNYEDNNWEFLNNNILIQSSVGTEAIYDSKRDKMVVIGGMTSSILFGFEEPIQNQTMEIWIFDYDTNNWISQVTNFGPMNGFGHSIIYDSNHDQIILYGGQNQIEASGGTWVFNFSIGTWLLQSSTLPEVHVFGSLIYNPDDKNAIYFDGWKLDENGVYMPSNEIWNLSLSGIVDPSEDLRFPKLNPWIVGILLTSTLSFTGIQIFIKTKYLIGKTPQIISGTDLARQLPINTKNLISSIFGRSADTYYIIGANFISKKKIDTDFEKVIPQELYDYKFLLHPMRLAMCRILSEQTTVATKELREMMGISWSDLSTHTRAMNEKKQIHIEEIIIDGKFVQVISLEPLGLINYQKLTQILLEVIDESLLFDIYLKEIGENNDSTNN